MNDPRRFGRVAPARSNFAACTALALLAAVSTALVPSCLERRSDDDARDSNETRCATCHGDPTREGDALLRAAPPRDLLGASGTAYPGVGAHAIHLYGGPTHGAVACNECHEVPERVDSPGHADDARPAELAFGSVAQSGGRSPHYDPIARTCADTACHRDHADAVWTEPRTSDAACGSCHGLPPPLPHPQSERCAACHGEVLDGKRHFVNPSLHVDGAVQAEPGKCSACHGVGDDGAPPPDTQGNEASSALGVGAHRAHLVGGAFSRPLACAECHLVPKTADEPGHAEGRPARVTLSGVAESGERSPSWRRDLASCADTWCHGPSAAERNESPSWVSGQSLDCTSCHGAPPPAPHPQISDCSSCHGAVVAADDVTIADRTRHVDGVVDVEVDPSCTSCHGTENSAPPRDTSGNTASTAAGVGAHQAHVTAGARSRAVACSECHIVPKDPLDPGHIDTALPAEVVFSGVATAFGAKPVYEQGTCRDSACHGGVFPNGHRSGGSNTAPEWTRVDGSQARCDGCHGMPPPRPHPYPTDCSSCHEDVAKDNLSFSRPELHIDGSVTFTLP